MRLGNPAQFQAILRSRSRKVLLLLVLSVTAGALATPTLGIVLNEIVAIGASTNNMNQQVQVVDANSGSGSESWQLQLQAQGATDFYVQHLVVGPGGYSGWHTHPGLLIGTVVSGGIDFYDANCQKHSFSKGQVFMENTEVHGIINTGAVDADLSIAYLIKHNAARRIEADAPACAPSTAIP